MTGSEGRSGERATDDDDSAIDSESRFEKFFDRLENEESKHGSDEGRSGLRTGSESESKTASETTAETDSDGWVWGLPESRHGREKPSSTMTPDLDEEIESESRGQAPQPGESGSDRIWNTMLEETGTESGADPSEIHSSDAETESAPVPQETISDVEDDGGAAENQGIQEGTADSTPKDRWEKLGSNLKGSEIEPRSPSDRPATTGESITDPEGSRQAIDSETDDPGWGATEVSVIASEVADENTFSRGQGPNDLDRIKDTASVLALGPTGHPVSGAICSRFLVDGEGTRDVIFVTFETPPSDLIDRCNRADGWVGGEIGIIEVGRGGRNAATTSEITSEIGGGSITIRHVAKPGDLSKLGIVITQLLTELETTPRRTVLCFQTLSALHNQIGTKTLFRFLNTLQGRLRSADAVGYYHMNPELHDEIVIETLRPIFESVVRFSADGRLEVE